MAGAVEIGQEYGVDGGGTPEVGAVLVTQLADLTEELGRLDAAVRQDLPDSVHRMRITLRRLKSLLASYRTILDPAVTASLRDELAWVGDALGLARDEEVVLDRLRSALRVGRPDLDAGRIARRLETTYAARYRDRHSEAVVRMQSQRYLDLRDRLDRLVESPPLRGKAQQAACLVVPAVVRHDFDRLRVRMEALSEPSDPGYDELLHEVRKAAKRVRYAADSADRVAGKAARRMSKAMMHLQSPLGVHHDTVLTRTELTRLADAATRAGESAFVYGVLYAREEGVAAARQAALPDLWRRANRRKLHAWLR